MLVHGFETERLKFRKLDEADVERWLKFCQDERAITYLWFDASEAKKASEEWIERQLTRYSIGEGGLCAVELKSSGELIGQCGILQQKMDDGPVWEVGYHFMPDHWGNGYATEAAVGCRDLGFEKGVSDFIVSMIHKENYPSQKVAKRNGMSVWRKNVEYRGFNLDIHRITIDEWLSIKKENGEAV